MKASNSEIRKFKRCRRSWWLTYVRRLRRRYEGAGPLSLGNMVHHVLEGYYSSPDRANFLETWRHVLASYVAARVEELEASGAEHAVPAMIADVELAGIMLEGYFEWLAEEGADQMVEVLSAEQEIEAYLGRIEGEDVWLMAKLDVQARLRDTGEVLSMDHKTVANLSDLPKVAHLDEQQLTYGLVQRIHHQQASVDAPRVGGALFNMLRKVKRTARANPPFYGRHAVRHNDWEFYNMSVRVMGEVADMLRVRRALEAGEDHRRVAYPNPTRDCSWDCPFFAVCGQFDDGSDVEAVIAEMYEEHDPYERYAELEKQ